MNQESDDDLVGDDDLIEDELLVATLKVCQQLLARCRKLRIERDSYMEMMRDNLEEFKRQRQVFRDEHDKLVSELAAAQDENKRIRSV